MVSRNTLMGYFICQPGTGPLFHGHIAFSINNHTGTRVIIPKVHATFLIGGWHPFLNLCTPKKITGLGDPLLKLFNWM